MYSSQKIFFLCIIVQVIVAVKGIHEGRHKRASVEHMVAIICRRHPDLSYCPPPPDTEEGSTVGPEHYTDDEDTTTAPPPLTTTISTKKAVDWVQLCLKHRDHYKQFCTTITDHPKDHQDTLQEFCPIYVKHCSKHLE